MFSSALWDLATGPAPTVLLGSQSMDPASSTGVPSQQHWAYLQTCSKLLCCKGELGPIPAWVRNSEVGPAMSSSKPSVILTQAQVWEPLVKRTLSMHLCSKTSPSLVWWRESILHSKNQAVAPPATDICFINTKLIPCSYLQVFLGTQLTFHLQPESSCKIMEGILNNT